jgi:hypothetical protein
LSTLLLVEIHRETLLRKQIKTLGGTGHLHLERSHGILRCSERSRQVGTITLLLLLLLLLELLLQLIMLQLKLLLQLITLLLLEELLHLNVHGTGYLMPGEPISRDEEPLLTIAAWLPGFSPIGVFLDEGCDDVHVLVDLLMVLLLMVLLLMVLLRLSLLLISHVALTLIVGGGKGERRERRRISSLTVLLAAGEAEREAVGVVLMVTHFENDGM